MAKQAERRTILWELLDLEEGFVQRVSAAAGPEWAERAQEARDGLQALRRICGSRVTPESVAAARAARDVLWASLVAADDPGQATPSTPSTASRAEVASILNEAALCMVRAEPTDPVAVAKLRDVLPAPESLVSPPTRETLARLHALLTGLVEETAASPADVWTEAGKLMDQLTSLVADEETAPAMSPERAEATKGSTRAAESPTAAAGPSGDVAAPVGTTTPPSGPPAESGGWALTEDTDAALVGDFVTECTEYTQGAEAALLELEGDPDQLEAINTVFRAFHTIKGTSGFLGIELLSELAHKAENLLSRMRDKKIRCTGGYADLALRANDGVKVLIDGVRQVLAGGTLAKPSGYDHLIETLENPEAFGINGETGEAAAPPAESESLVGQGAEPAAESAADNPEAGGDAAAAADAAGAAGVIRVAQAMQGQKSAAGAGAEAGDSSVRVRTDRLDRLIDMVGELVIAHSMVSEDGELTTARNADLVRKVAHSGKIVRELQDLSMSMRMVPLKPTFLKLSRLVRDLTHKNDRQIAFQTRGEDTEIDRNMVDVLADPLIHMIRNACDHGVEPPDERAAAGKDRSGRVILSAYHAGGNVVVELQDDGRGLNREKIAKKAIERGLIESDKGMSDSDVYGLIFEAGFSTAEKITEVSGRGVGMDVVRRAVQSLRGRIEIQSALGRGTTFVIKLPLTLAVTDGMLIRVGLQRFILPTASIQMSFRPDASAVKSVLGRGELVNLRNELIPVVRLYQLFGIPGAIETPTNALLVIIADGERRSAVLVDEILGQQQVVAKSLGEGSGKVVGVAGGAILGDGRVGLILDPAGLIGLARGGSSWEHRALVEANG